MTLGQTDSGKTYLLHGPKASRTPSGILASISNSIFDNLDKKTSDYGYNYSGSQRVGLQSFEIYSELARDLLDPKRDGLDVEMSESEGATVRGISTQWVNTGMDLSQKLATVSWLSRFNL